MRSNDSASCAWWTSTWRCTAGWWRSIVDQRFADVSGPTGLTVLAVFAHPDDESLACGGTLARLSDVGARVVLMCASHGERGGVGGPTEDEELGRARARELQDAAAMLG